MDFDIAKKNMIAGLLRPQGILNADILAAITNTRRECFIEEKYRTFTFVDQFLPLLKGAWMLSPSIEAKILSLFVSCSSGIRGEQKALLIGLGSGYLAALMACFFKSVYVLEKDAEILAWGQQHLQSQHVRNVFPILKDGQEGYIEHSPYDAIVYTAAISDALASKVSPQLAVSGKMFYPVWQTEILSLACSVVHLEKNIFHSDVLFETVWPEKLSMLEEAVFHF